MLPRHVSFSPIVPPMVTPPVLHFIWCFVAWTWRIWLQGKLQLFLRLRFPFCGHHPPNSLCWLQLGSAESCHLFSCCSPSVALSLATQLLSEEWELSHTLGWHLLLALGQDWGPAASCQCSGPLGLVLVLCHLHLPEAWLVEALCD